MPQYTLYFDHLDGDTGIGQRTVDGDTPTDLAQAVHRHARGYLGSRTVDIHLDEETLAGSVTRNGHLVGEFTLTADEPAPAPPVSPHKYLDELRHGYTIADLERLSRIGARVSSWARAADFEEFMAAARVAIAAHLYDPETRQRPQEFELIRVAASAAGSLAAKTMSSWGVSHQGGSTFGQRMPQFERYWFALAPSSPEAGVVERLGLWQIWESMTDGQREVLLALAVHEDYQTAADALGYDYVSFVGRVSRARAAFRRLWHEGETPSRMWGSDRRKSVSHNTLSSTLRDRRRHERVRAAA